MAGVNSFDESPYRPPVTRGRVAKAPRPSSRLSLNAVTTSWYSGSPPAPGSCFATLKVDVRILGRPTHDRPIRIQTASAMLADQVIVDHRAQVFFRHQFESVDLVRGAETVEEVDEWQPRLERCRVRDQRHVLGFLD